MRLRQPPRWIRTDTRLLALSEANPCWAFGSVFYILGGASVEHTKAWPVPRMTPILTRDNLTDVNGSADKLRTILRRSGLGQVLARNADEVALVLIVPTPFTRKSRLTQR